MLHAEDGRRHYQRNIKETNQLQTTVQQTKEFIEP